MKPLSRFLPYILADILLTIVCLIGVYQIYIKADLPSTILTAVPFNIHKDSEKLVPINLNYDDIVMLDGLHFDSREEIEEYLDSKNIGDNVLLKYSFKGTGINLNVELVRFYSIIYTATCLIVSLVFIFLGIFVLSKSKDYKAAKVFHWASIGTAVIIACTWGNYSAEPLILGKITRVFFNAAYAFVPALFINFTLIFPSEKRFNYKILANLFYIFSFLLAFSLSFQFLMYSEMYSLRWLKWYLTFFNIQRAYTIVAVVLSILIFIHSYKTTSEEIERKKLRWLLLGFMAGPLVFILLWVIPQAITSYALIPEEIVIILMAAVPVSFSIAILKHHVMNIDILIRRSVIYSIVLTFLVIIYIAVFYGLTLFIKGINDTVPAIISAVVVAFILQPAKIKVQKFVDRKFFRVQYDFRMELNQFLADINELNDIKSLSGKIVEKTNSLIPVEKIGFFNFNSENSMVKLLSHKNFDLLKNHGVKFHLDKLKSALSYPIAVAGKIEAGVEIESADKKVFTRWGMSLVFPIISKQNIIFGFLVLGDKKSSNKFSAEDVDLLKTVVGRTAITIERIKLQEELIREQFEMERLEELNKIKSFFVSSVSHDLKTPLTSIKMFAEMIKDNKNIGSEKRNEYLHIVIGESNRLSRLINNVLDYTKIENGIKAYNFETVEVNKSIEEILTSMEYQFTIQKFNVCRKFYSVELLVNADKDSFDEAVTNLLSNALKFSIEKKQIEMSTYMKNDKIYISVKDFGIGIDKEEINKIFEPFFRSNETKAHKAVGTGLGLSIVKYIMDAHKGKVEVQSERGSGSTFTLIFPRIQKSFKDNLNENHINH